MADLLFIATILSLVIYFVRIVFRLIKQKPIKTTLKVFGIILLSYSMILAFSYLFREEIIIEYGTDVCFDDWCASITKTERLAKEEIDVVCTGQIIVLHLKLSNHARGRAQKPSEPRVKIVDMDGNEYVVWKRGQQALEVKRGKQRGIDEKLELHEEVMTELVFEVPNHIQGLKGVIEEGPFITKLLLQGDKEIFMLK